ncbi:acyltransferase [Paenibacillus kobensis]|uniref:acyltransferase n=1 Tax=Paenibacillus kobensis TaxID=59841 RepID=UPI000FDBA45D|nr:acyltransferase [Paenibacillus kobensis]
MSNRKPVVHELNVMRGIAMLGVLTVHSTSSAVAALNESSLFGLFNTLNVLALFCVPAFIFLSGFVLLYNYSDQKIGLRSLGTFYRKRLLYILVPYAFISLLYLGIKQLYVIRAGGSVETLPVLDKYWHYLLTGNAYTHLYYIIITVQLYLVFPLLLYVLQKVRNRGLWLVVLGIAIQAGFYYANRYWLHVPSKGSVALTYAGTFLLGVYAALNYERMNAWINKRMPVRRTVLWLLWAASAVIFVTVWHRYRTGDHTYPSEAFEFGYEAYTLLTIPVLLQISGWIRRLKSRTLENRMNDLGGLSFGIYLIHPVFLLAYRELVPLPGMPYQYIAWVAGIFITALAGSLLVLFLAFRVTGWSWLLFGQVPAKFRRKSVTAGAESGNQNGVRHSG